jgi:hypothetical protein
MVKTAARGALTGLWVWGWSAPFLVGGIVLSELGSVTGMTDIFLILAVGAVSQLALGLVIWVSRFTLLTAKARENAGVGRVAAVLLVAGAARGGALFGGFSVFEVGQEVSWWVRVMTSGLLITVSFLLSAYSLELWRQYIKRRRELLTTIATQETAVGRQEIAMEAYRDLVGNGVEEDIEGAKRQTLRVIDTISAKIEAGGISQDELEKLFGESDRAWREVSHRAWIGSNTNIPRLTVSELAITLMDSKPVWLIVFWLSGAFGLFRVLGPEIGLPVALQVAGLILAGQLVVGWLVNLLSTTGAPWNQMSFGAGVVVLVAWPIVVATWWDLAPVVGATVSWLGVLGAFFSISLGLPVALAKSGEAILAQLEKRVDDSALRQLRAQGEMFVLAQKVGAYLHGPLRSQFLQLSMELRAVLEKADPHGVATTLAKIRDAVSGLDVEVDQAPTLRQFLDNWSGLIRVDTNIDDIHLPNQVHDRAVTVVTEAVNNSVRHGKATRVGVFFRYRPEGLLVEVIGAPMGTDDSGEAGLGAHILNELAPGMWFQDVSEEGRYRLRVTLKTAG